MASRFVRRLLEHVRWRGSRVPDSLAAARRVDESTRYFVRDTLFARAGGRKVTRWYGVGGRSFRIVHATHDPGTFGEVFVQRLYELPAPTLSALGHAPKIADLGGNIGAFGLWASLRWPQGELVAFEPDPVSAARYREFLAANALPWRMVEACAGARAGVARFAADRQAESRMSAEGTLVVPVVDVFDHLADCGLVKMDIEGGEWDILLDERFASLPAQAVVLEYHDHLCPEADAKALATQVLEDAGYAVDPLFHNPHVGAGMLRAVRPAA